MEKFVKIVIFYLGRTFEEKVNMETVLTIHGPAD